MALSPSDARLIAALEEGLALSPRPFAALAAAAGMGEEEAIARLRALAAEGVIRRLGLIVRHHELGYRANAMVVWDVPDQRVDEVGAALGRTPGVSLCYRRPRRPPEWPYNLFTMIHGRDRGAVEGEVARLASALGLEGATRETLFSLRRFKQRGARYASRGTGLAA